MSDSALFTDASLHVKLHCGVGAFLVLPAAVLDLPGGRSAAAGFFDRLRFQRFAATSSTAIEVQTALWALESYRKDCKDDGAGRLHLYTQ
jgi:hypothetical protein